MFIILQSTEYYLNGKILSLEILNCLKVKLLRMEEVPLVGEVHLEGLRLEEGHLVEVLLVVVVHLVVLHLVVVLLVEELHLEGHHLDGVLLVGEDLSEPKQLTPK